MTANSPEEHAFINRLAQIIEINLANEDFGVSELANEMHISRSHLHRQIKKITTHSSSQFICKVRLEKAMQMLQQNVASASEVAYNVGFNSPAYFSRCFHKYYGFPPGEVKKRFTEIDVDIPNLFQPNNNQALCSAEKPVRKKWLILTSLAMCVLIIAAVIYTGFTYEIFSSKRIKKDQKLSIIVLPFENFSENHQSEHFSDGIREDILNNLYWITALRVVSRTSSEQFRGSTLSARAIGKKMNVQYVLEGSVRWDGNRVKITVQLIDVTRREDHLLSESFERELDDVMGVQNEIALLVASKLKAVLSEKERQKIEKISTHNAKAYDYYLHARALLHKANSENRSGFNSEGVLNCLKYYEMAIAEDENFAEAYSGLANANFKLSAWGIIPGYQGFRKAKKLCDQALEIDPECAEAHCFLGAFYVWGQRDFNAGKEAYQTSIRLNPNFATARQGYAQFLMITGPIEEARIQVNYALALEPYFWLIHNLDSWIYYFQEKYDESLKACSIARDYNPKFSSNEWLFVLNYAKLNEGEKMMQQLQNIAKRYSKSEEHTEAIRQAYNESGIRGLFYWLIDVNKNNPIRVEGMNGHPYFIAWWYTILGDEEEAVFWLEKNMLENRKMFHYFNLIATNPDFDILRDNPHFLKIVDDIGLSPYHKRKSK